MAFISALAVSLWKVDPPLELLLAGPVFALALYLRSSYRTVLAVRDAETDALTGLGNHRSFQIELRRALDTAEEDVGLMSLVLIDLDAFKDINDRFGHPVGDAVLRVVADVLREECGAGRRLPDRRRGVRGAPARAHGADRRRHHRPRASAAGRYRVPPRRAGDRQRRPRGVPRACRRPREALRRRRRRPLLGEEPRQEPVVRVQPGGGAVVHAGRAGRGGRAACPPARGRGPDPGRGRQGHLRGRALAVGVAPGRGDRAIDGARRRGGRAGAPGRPAARPGQDRDPRPDPAEAGQARPRRAEGDARAPGARRAAARGAGRLAGRPLDPAPPRVVGRLRLSRSA